MGCTWCVEALAWIAASRQQHERAAVLLGGAASLLQSMGTTLDGHQPISDHQRDCERQARKALGDEAFRAAYRRGLELSAADVLACALQQPPERPPEKPSAPAASEGALLTPRELQVAGLIGRGRSNKDIAAALVISQRTAENHVEHILTKLGFTSRAQVAAWVAASQRD
jgi:DNA-binding NarL/FixJ family response regulator